MSKPANQGPGPYSRHADAAALAVLVALLVLALPRTAAAAAYTDQDGHAVEVVAPNLPPNQARDQSFVNLLGSLVHSFEMGGHTLYLAASQAEVNQECPQEAAACYHGGSVKKMVIPGWLSAWQARHLLAHEYGHAIADSRGNPPRGALSDGTIRWASYEGICQGLRAGEYGDFSWSTKPVEAFAQAYATLNFADAPWGPASMPLVESLRPDAGALAAVQQDVLEPWQPTVETIKGRLKRSGKITRQLSLPLDGPLAARLETARRLKAKLVLIVDGTKLRGRSLGYEVCGERAALLRVIARKKTKGKFKVSIARP